MRYFLSLKSKVQSNIFFKVNIMVEFLSIYPDYEHSLIVKQITAPN